VWEYYAEGTVSFRFINQNVSFGEMEDGQSNSTADDNPAPFILENDGNVIIDINISASAPLWLSEPLDTMYWTFMASDRNEPGSFNITGSQNTWGYMPSSSVLAIRQLNWSDATDSAVVDVGIKVPADEPAGTKSADVNFNAERSG
jgi:hypothetical protein